VAIGCPGTSSSIRFWFKISQTPPTKAFCPFERRDDVVDLHGKDHTLGSSPGYATAEAGLFGTDEPMGAAHVAVHRGEASLPYRPTEDIPVEGRQTVNVNRPELEVHHPGRHAILP
jgi:hypothetical protein